MTELTNKTFYTNKQKRISATNDAITESTRCLKTSRTLTQLVRAADATAAAGSSAEAAICGSGRIGRIMLRRWLKRAEIHFGTVAINAGTAGAKTAAHVQKDDTALGALQADKSCIDGANTIDGKKGK